MANAEMLILLLVSVSFGAASYCNTDVNFLVTGQKEGDDNWDARGYVFNSGLRYSDGKGVEDLVGDMWNISVDVEQCTTQCETNPHVQITVEAKRNPPSPLAGYEVYPEIGNYKAHKEDATWDDARLACIREGAHLVVINSQEEADTVTGILKRLSLFTTYVGLHSLYADKEFTTIFDQPISTSGFEVWKQGEPNDFGGKEHCVHMYDYAQYNDISCDSKFPFICEQEVY